MTLAVGITLAALAVPAVKSSVQYFRVRSAVSSITGAIQSTRYRAIFDGCPYNLSFSSTGNTFQVASEAISGGACATTFTNVVSIHHGANERVKFRDANDYHSADELV